MARLKFGNQHNRYELTSIYKYSIENNLLPSSDTLLCYRKKEFVNADPAMNLNSWRAIRKEVNVLEDWYVGY